MPHTLLFDIEICPDKLGASQEGSTMRRGVIEVGPQRYRESYGRYFEEFREGDVYEHRPGRTITENDNIWFTLLTMNTHPLHFDHVYAAKTEFGKPLVNSPLTVAILVGMSVSDVSQKAVANLGWKEIRMTAPVFAGDTLYGESEVIEKRESKSRPEQGLVTIKTTGRNQDGVIVCDFLRTMLIWKEGFGPGDE
jgi:itaconyl-CoA hydratase